MPSYFIIMLNFSLFSAISMSTGEVPMIAVGISSPPLCSFSRGIVVLNVWPRTAVPHQLFLFDDIHDILRVRRLKKSLSSVIVSRYGFRVLLMIWASIPLLMLFSMYCTIVEFNTLADPDRACAQDEDLLIVRGFSLTHLLVA